MKLIYTHYAFDRKLIIFQFSADGRIDFRELLRDLSGLFKVRVELRQVGVRDEASILGGVGTCGRPFCCAQFLKSFNSINVKMAKQQGLPLNPLNISGCCGRLKCCLQFEAETYREMNAEMKQKQSEESAQDSNAADIELPPEDMFDEEGTIVTAKPISIPAAEYNQDAQRGPSMTRQQHQQEKRKEHFQARQHASHDNPQQPGNAKPHNNRPNHNPPKKPLPPPAPGENGSAQAGENRHSQQGPRPPKPNGERRHGHRDHNRGDRNRAEQQAQNGNASSQHPQSTPQRDSSIGDFGN